MRKPDSGTRAVLCTSLGRYARDPQCAGGVVGQRWERKKKGWIASGGQGCWPTLGACMDSTGRCCSSQSGSHEKRRNPQCSPGTHRRKDSGGYPNLARPRTVLTLAEPDNGPAPPGGRIVAHGKGARAAVRMARRRWSRARGAACGSGDKSFPGNDRRERVLQAVLVGRSIAHASYASIKTVGLPELNAGRDLPGLGTSLSIRRRSPCCTPWTVPYGTHMLHCGAATWVSPASSPVFCSSSPRVGAPCLRIRCGA